MEKLYKKVFSKIDQYRVDSIMPFLFDNEAYLKVKLGGVYPDNAAKSDLEDELTLLSNENIEFVHDDEDVIFRLTNS